MNPRLAEPEQPNSEALDASLKSRAIGLVQQAYSSLPVHGKPGAQESTVLAAVVLSDAAKALSLVSLATGTKCLNHKAAVDGRLARDLHAEVLARRAACLWLYKQLHHSLLCSSCTINCSSTFRSLKQHGLISTRIPSSIEPFEYDQNKKCFHLCEGYKFHLLVSHPPCGDACITSPTEGSGDAGRTHSTASPNPDACTPEPFQEPAAIIHGTGAKRLLPLTSPTHSSAPSKRQRGAAQAVQARVPQQGDVEGGLQVPGLLRRKPGRGTPTLSMSCSDKLAKWQLCGWQGALLSHFLARPLRFHPVIGGYEGLAHPQQGGGVCPPSDLPHAAVHAAQCAALRRAVHTRCEGSWAEICSGGASAHSLQQAAAWLQTWKQEQPQVELAPQGLGCSNCSLPLDGRARLANTCMCWSSAVVCEGRAGASILLPDGRPSWSYQVLLGKHGRPAGANKQQGSAVLVSRHSLLGQFAALKAAVDAAGGGGAADCGGQGASAVLEEHGLQRCGSSCSEIEQDFDARYRSLKAQHAGMYMAAWSSLLRTAMFALWLCGSTLPEHEQHSKNVAV